MFPTPAGCNHVHRTSRPSSLLNTLRSPGLLARTRASHMLSAATVAVSPPDLCIPPTVMLASLAASGRALQHTGASCFSSFAHFGCWFSACQRYFLRIVSVGLSTFSDVFLGSTYFVQQLEPWSTWRQVPGWGWGDSQPGVGTGEPGLSCPRMGGQRSDGPPCGAWPARPIPSRLFLSHLYQPHAFLRSPAPWFLHTEPTRCVCNSVVFTVFTGLCNHHHHPSENISITPQRNLISLATPPHPWRPPAHRLSVPVDSPVVDARAMDSHTVWPLVTRFFHLAPRFQGSSTCHVFQGFTPLGLPNRRSVYG